MIEFFFVDNYCAHKETRKNFNRDKTAYTVLLKCLKLTNYYFDRISTATPKLLESAPVPILTLNYPGQKTCTIPAPTTLQKLQVLTRVVFDIPPQTKFVIVPKNGNAISDMTQIKESCVCDVTIIENFL